MENYNTLVKCPNCGNNFSAESAIENDLRERINKEFQKKNALREQEVKKRLDEIEKEKLTVERWKNDQGEILKKKLAEGKIEIEETAKRKAAEEFDNHIKHLQKENEEKSLKLKSLQQKELEFMQREKLLSERAEEMEMVMQKKLNEREEEIRKNAERIAEQRADLQLKQKESDFKRKTEELDLEIARKAQDAGEKVRQEEQFKIAEMQKQLDDQKKLVEEMRKKSEQGSMQLQGEVQELELETVLKNSFPADHIDEVGKGIKGADCVQWVINSFGQRCGGIIYESKRTKGFSTEWIAKLKSDMRIVNAEIAVIVTEALPKELNRFGQIDGVLVCTFAEVKSIAMLLRDSLIRIHQAVVSQDHKGDKVQMLYEYLTGNEFTQRMQGIVDAFNIMQDDLIKERKTFTLAWEKRQKQLDKVMQNTISMYGSVKGIAGGAIQEVKGLDMDDSDVLLLV